MLEEQGGLLEQCGGLARGEGLCVSLWQGCGLLFRERDVIFHNWVMGNRTPTVNDKLGPEVFLVICKQYICLTQHPNALNWLHSMGPIHTFPSSPDRSQWFALLPACEALFKTGVHCLSKVLTKCFLSNFNCVGHGWQTQVTWRKTHSLCSTSGFSESKASGCMETVMWWGTKTSRGWEELLVGHLCLKPRCLCSTLLFREMLTPWFFCLKGHLKGHF